MLTDIKKWLRGAGFVTHVGLATSKLVAAAGIALILVVAAESTTVAETHDNCTFLRMEPRGGETLTVMSCGGRELSTVRHSAAGWAWQNRERRMVCEATSSGSILRCELAQ